MGNKEKQNNTHEIIEKNLFQYVKCEENITVLDLSNREISDFNIDVVLPQNLIVLIISNNKFAEIPLTVMQLSNLKELDVSFNQITLFDEKPQFCDTLESLNISNNNLHGPPYWIWADQPKKLTHLNLSNNSNLCEYFDEIYFEELLQYKTLVKEIDLYNCKFGKHIKLLSTVKNAEIVNLGDSTYNYLSVNHIEKVPCPGLEDCRDVKVLNLCNTNIYTIQHNIDIYKNLIEINLAQNNINSLPNEFCNLENMEICILSFNKILYLPDFMHKLTKLTKLYLDNNDLCMLPQNLNQLDKLKTLDLYNNHLYDGLEDIKNLDEYDFAQNYADEPSNDEYTEKKLKLRQNNCTRVDGRAQEIVNEESEQSEKESCDGDLPLDNESLVPETQDANDTRCSSPEDWDSDDYWIPSHVDLPSHSQLVNKNKYQSSPYALQWLNYVKRKMAEGNFCPMDMHLSISITDQVRIEKMVNPKPVCEVDGQFDDYSDDDS